MGAVSGRGASTTLPMLVASTPRLTVPRVRLARNGFTGYAVCVRKESPELSLPALRMRLRPLCEKHRIRRLEVFGSVARGETTAESDVDLLATLDESVAISTAELLDMAGEAEELVGRPVDFVLRSSLEKSSDPFAREHILSTAVCVYGS